MAVEEVAGKDSTAAFVAKMDNRLRDLWRRWRCEENFALRSNQLF